MACGRVFWNCCNERAWAKFAPAAGFGVEREQSRRLASPGRNLIADSWTMIAPASTSFSLKYGMRGRGAHVGLESALLTTVSNAALNSRVCENHKMRTSAVRLARISANWG